MIKWLKNNDDQKNGGFENIFGRSQKTLHVEKCLFLVIYCPSIKRFCTGKGSMQTRAASFHKVCFHQ